MATQTTAAAFKSDGTFNPALSYWDDPPKFPAMVLIYADFCGHCRNFMPTFNKLANRAGDQIGFYKVDGADEEVPGVQGYPTIIVFPTATSTGFLYDGNRDMASMWMFAKQVYIRASQMGA